ncbi:phenylacetic acid degradation protein [Mechercharimyces sp. CAU 1602]|uniref:phenylacetic acid degradation protein n=1 Tax=Mechercharimyces sp. CAU 1602 TaxID=2973933 RepID=UPI002163376A|nr:phenylacetic acid degradation protein [Mechercharimyces sp. CAU 1602]MCS1351728.1 phenylacetic acid degradation protein [Mechercharimyces sp. CAU 1602]
MSQQGQQGEYEIYEVFVQKTHKDMHMHVGSVKAPSAEFALQVARENFLRRDEAISLWVVRQAVIHHAPGERFFTRSMDRSYREVKGYTENGRLWRTYREHPLPVEKEEQRVTKSEAVEEGSV